MLPLTCPNSDIHWTQFLYTFLENGTQLEMLGWWLNWWNQSQGSVSTEVSGLCAKKNKVNYRRGQCTTKMLHIVQTILKWNILFMKLISDTIWSNNFLVLNQLYLTQNWSDNESSHIKSFNITIHFTFSFALSAN